MGGEDMRGKKGGEKKQRRVRKSGVEKKKEVKGNEQ